MTAARHTRRSFLQRGLALSALASAPLLIPGSVFGMAAPGKLLNIGHIGVGGRGRDLMGGFLAVKSCRIVAVSDCFDDRREAAARQVNTAYKGEYCSSYRDLRELIARPDIDAVAIATPDHWHVPAALMAVRSGKSVYVEKPLGLSIAQNQSIRAACRRHAVTFQYGTQQRSSRHVRHGCELVRNGRIGKLLSVEVVSPASSSGGSTAPIAVPEGFDYDMWLGPAPLAPYTSDRCTNAGAWFISDYALGFIAGWGAHPLDVAVWALGDSPEAVPIEFEGTGEFPTEGLFDTATSWDVRGRYTNGAAFHFRGPGENLTVFTGDQGKVSISRAWLRTEPPSLAAEIIGPEEVQLRRSYNHGADFLEAIRTGSSTVAPVEAAVLSDNISHLSDIAIRAGRLIRWDPTSEKIVGDESAARRSMRTVREPWTT
jgi:glucose-fructose oxidoreductase